MQRGWVISPEYRTAIETISAARKELGVSQRELARRICKPPSFVNKIEQLERRLDILEFIALADALGLDAPQLLASIQRALPKQIAL